MSKLKYPLAATALYLLIDPYFEYLRNFQKVEIINWGNFRYKSLFLNSDIIRRTWRPSLLMNIPLVNLYYFSSYRKKLHPNINSRIITLRDGAEYTLTIFKDALDTNDYNNLSTPKEDYIQQKYILYVGGIDTKVRSNYLQSFTHEVSQKGYSTVYIQGRGYAGNSYGQNRKIYPYNFSDDMAQIEQYIFTHFNVEVAHAVGVSLGSLFLTKYFIDAGDKTKVKSLTSICNPFSLPDALEHMKKYNRVVYNTFNAVYTKKFRKMMYIDPLFRSSMQEQGLDMDAAMFGNDLWYIIRIFAANVGMEFASYKKEYLRMDRLDRLKIPTLFINSANDDICPFLEEYAREIEKNPECLLLKPRTGGHIGLWTAYEWKHKWIDWNLEWMRAFDQR